MEPANADHDLRRLGETAEFIAELERLAAGPFTSEGRGVEINAKRMCRFGSGEVRRLDFLLRGREGSTAKPSQPLDSTPVERKSSRAPASSRRSLNLGAGDRVKRGSRPPYSAFSSCSALVRARSFLTSSTSAACLRSAPRSARTFSHAAAIFSSQRRRSGSIRESVPVAAVPKAQPSPSRSRSSATSPAAPVFSTTT
jgi:hypothetical protein